MASFFERGSYSAKTLEHDLEKMKNLYSHSSEEKMSRIPLILTCHALNTRVQRILLDNFKVIADDPATGLIFSQPSMVAFRQDYIQLANITSSHGRKAGCNTRRDLSMSKPTLPNLWPYFQRIVLLGPNDRLNIKDSLTCLSSGLIYCIPCRRCPAIYISETGPTHRAILVNISEASTRMRLDFPSRSISVLMGIPLPMHWSAGLNSAMGTNRGRGRKCVSSFDSSHASRAASILIFTSFKARARVQNATLKLKFNTRYRGTTRNEHFTDEGHSPEKSGLHLHQHSSFLFIVVTSTTQPTTFS